MKPPGATLALTSDSALWLTPYERRQLRSTTRRPFNWKSLLRNVIRTFTVLYGVKEEASHTTVGMRRVIEESPREGKTETWERKENARGMKEAEHLLQCIELCHLSVHSFRVRVFWSTGMYRARFYI